MSTSTNESLEMASSSSFFLQSCSQLELEAQDEAMPVYKPTAHDCGECNPCAFAIKAGGCTKADCCHCHEDHSREHFKFSQKRNRAKCMAIKHGDETRFTKTWAE